MSRSEITSRAIITKGDEILLIHRRKNGEEYFVLPGGGIEDTETPEEAMEREVYEETGLKVTTTHSGFEVTDINGKKVYVYYVDVEAGIPELIGEEKEYSHEADWYNPEWFDISIINQPNVYPVPARIRLLEDLKNK